MEPRPGRTIELWLLALGLLGASLSGWLRLDFVIQAWSFLPQAGVWPGPVYQAIAGGVWGLSGLLCAGGLLLRLRWAPGATRATVLFLAIWYWLDSLLLTRAADANDNWPYRLGLTLIAVLFTFFVLALDRQKRFFNS